MSENEVADVKVVTEEELTMTQEEYVRLILRGQVDTFNLIQNNVPPQVAAAVASFRYNHQTRYHVGLLKVDGIPTACIFVNVNETEKAVFAIINDSHTLTDMQDNDVKHMSQPIPDKGSMN